MIYAGTSTPALYHIPQSNVHLLDMPGFDESYMADRETLRRICDELDRFFRDKFDISGVIYVQDINESPYSSSAMKKLAIFKKLIGADYMHKCAIVTTKWAHVDPQTGGEREHELLNDEKFWQPVITAGAKSARFNGTKRSAMDIIRPLCQSQTFVPEVIREWIASNDLSLTQAGREIEGRIGEVKKDYEAQAKKLAEATEKALEAGDVETARPLQERSRELAAKLQAIHNEQHVLKERHDEYVVTENPEEKKKAKTMRWIMRGFVGGACTLATIGTAGILAPVAIYVYARVESDLQKEKKIEKAKR